MRKIFINSIIFFFSVLMLLPIFFLLAGMLLGKEEAVTIFMPILTGEEEVALFLFPKHPTLNPIVNMILKTTNFYRAFWNSCAIVFPILLLQVLFAAPAAWAFSQFEFRFKKLIYFIYLFFMILPFIVTMLPTYLLMQKLNFLDSYLSLVLPAAFSTFPVFVMERFFSKIPFDYIEQAKSLGANHWQIFWQIGLPLGFPGILASVMFSFTKYWNEIEAPMLLLNTQSKWPSSLWLSDISINFFGETLTACAINFIPPLFIFIYGIRQFKRIGDVTNG